MQVINEVHNEWKTSRIEDLLYPPQKKKSLAVEAGGMRVEAQAQINSPERCIIVFSFRPVGTERYKKLKGCQLV